MSGGRGAWVWLALAGVVLVVAAVLSVWTLNEAYGAGPPYYSRTTNMDKWSDPLPAVLIGDLLAAGVAAVLVWVGQRKRGRRR